MPLKRWIRAALGAACLALPSWIHAAGLFLPVAPTGVAVESQGASAAMAGREQRVRIARHELSAVRHDVENAGAGRLVLNVADGAHFDVVVERTAPTKWGYSLSGRVAGGGVGFVTLVVHEDAVAGSIWTPNAEYELSFLGGGVHALRDVTNAPPMECGGALPSDSAQAGADAQGGTDDSPIVDILIVWTPEAEEKWGGVSQVLSRIDMLIAYTNDAFERSGAFVALNLVGAEKVDYLETDRATDLGRLGIPDDGYMDGVHDQRDALGADLVYLMTSSCCLGQAYLGGPFSIGGAIARIFAHEVGHNLGLHHDRRADGYWGFQNGFTTEHCLATIMSYGANCERFNGPEIPYFASPWRYDPANGMPLGVTRLAKNQGARGPADAVLALNRSSRDAANFRSSRAESNSDGEARRIGTQDASVHFVVTPALVATNVEAELALPTSTASEAVDSETLVDIPDSVLRQAVEERLAKASGDPITRTDMARLVDLTAVGERP